jgi:predicted alpha/beta superfamily hydrolase
MPDSIEARSFIVRGLGNPESFGSSSHEAGRVIVAMKARRRVRAIYSVGVPRYAAGRTNDAGGSATRTDERIRAMSRAKLCTPFACPGFELIKPLAPLLLALSVAACQATPPPAAPCPPAAQSAEPGAAPVGTASGGSTAPRKLVIQNSELIDLHSEQTGRDYELIVGVPDSYGKEPERRYPVLYLLDGQWDFNLINTLTGGLRYDKVIPEFLLVGISYGGENPNYGELRLGDYTPTRWQHPGAKEPRGGDGAKFLRFLEENVIPTIEGRYRVDSAERMLAGSSAGGLFTLYALFEKPDLFQSYLALSPAVGWDSPFMFRREREFRAKGRALSKRVWLSVGELEEPDNVKPNKEFFAQFQASHYEGISLRFQVVPGERHAGVKPEAFNRALRFVFEPWAATQKQD